MTATLYHTEQHLWTQCVLFDIENDIALCFLISLQLYVLSVIWHAFILKASSRCWQEVVVAMETRKVSQRAELVIKSAIIKPTHLEGRYDWSIVLSCDITLSFSYYSNPLWIAERPAIVTDIQTETEQADSKDLFIWKCYFIKSSFFSVKLMKNITKIILTKYIF